MKELTFITLLFCFWTATNAQSEKTSKQDVEILVYIMPDSLELSPALKRGAKLQEVVAKSSQLNEAFAIINTKSIAKAFVISK